MIAKCQHCGEDIRSVRLWLPRPASEPFWLPPPFEVGYVALEDGNRFCRGMTDPWPLLDELDAAEVELPHQPMPRIGK